MKNQPLKNSYLVLAVLFAVVVLISVAILAIYWLPQSTKADALLQALPSPVVRVLAPAVKSAEEQQLESLDLTLPQSDFDSLQNDISGL